MSCYPWQCIRVHTKKNPNEKPMSTEMQNLEQSPKYEGYCVTSDYYDLIYQDIAPDDLAFYLELAESLPGPVLELGCGTGRITLELAKAGHRVVGLDTSSAMLEKLQAKWASQSADVQDLVELSRGSMEDFQLGGQFGLVLAPFRAFQHLLSPDAQRNCLACIKSHLLPDGRFVFNAFEPNLDYIYKVKQQGPAWQFSNEAGDGKAITVKRFYRNSYDMANQLISVNWKYEVCDLDGKLLDTRFEEMRLRWTYRYEAQHLLELCGLEVLESYADYQRTPLGAKALELIFICRKATGSSLN